MRTQTARSPRSAGPAAAGPTPTDAGSDRSRSADEYGHLAPLLAQYAGLDPADGRRSALRARLADGYLPVVHHIALRYDRRGVALDDLVQVGSIGLLKALDRFDPALSGSFLTYLIPTVTGEIRHYFRDHAWAVRVPRPLKDIQAPLRAAAAVLTTELNRAPRPSEIAARLGIDREQVIEALRVQDAYRPASLDGDTGTDTGDSALVRSLGQLDAAFGQVENRESIKRALATLAPRDRDIIVLRFFGELTQSQIAEQVGLSQMHVSRLLAQALKLLRTAMTTL
ncbi:SigB/SigF/SigG family RNA polymerase sigma factor [Pseudonocardia sp. GCM10023141]|uniref:SigB/SigF/SigG family RNA polymerase sigma factor n=1 Tax=Pseudonocardia sp. GCM10023141 TaxID=3252653 RepID=UPI00361BB728